MRVMTGPIEQTGIMLNAILTDGGPRLFRDVEPTLLLDGYEASARWGGNYLPLPPGRHHLRMHVRYPAFRRFGPAELTIDVPRGQLVQLEYKTPLWTFSAGALGPAPQRARGGWAVLWALAAIIGGACLIGVAAVLYGKLTGRSP